MTITSFAGSTPERRQRDGLLLWIVFAAYLFGTLASPAPPMLQDYPTWVYESSIISAFFRGDAVAGYHLLQYPVPNAVTQAGLAVFMLVLPWAAAAKLWICLYILFALAVARRLLAVNLSNANVHVIGAVAVFGLPFWYGLINFQIGVLLLIFLALDIRRGVTALRCNTLLSLLFFAHIIPFTLGVLVVMAARGQTDRAWLVRSLVLPALLSAWFLAGNYLFGSPAAPPLTVTDLASSQPLLFKLNTFFKSFGYVSPFVGERSVSRAVFGSAGTCVYLACAAAMAVLATYGLVRAAAQTPRAGMVRGCAPAGVSLVLACLLPPTFAGVADPGSRYMTCGLALALLFQAQKKAWQAPVAVLAAAVLCAGGVLYVCMAFTNLSGLPADPRPVPSWLRFAHVNPSGRADAYRLTAERDVSGAIFGTSILRKDDGAPPL